MLQSSWKFLKTPFWVFSHFFILASVCLFIFLSSWQWSRLAERRAENTRIVEQSEARPIDSDQLAKLQGDVEYRSFAGELRFLDGDIARVANRSNNGIAGEYVIALAETEIGQKILVNIGFVPLQTKSSGLTKLPEGNVQISGWLRKSVSKELFGVADTGKGNLVPRFNIADIIKRLPVKDRDVLPFGLQLDEYEGQSKKSVPVPVGLPVLSEGSHQSYAIQWIIFAVLTVGFYIALLNRKAKKNAS